MARTKATQEATPVTKQELIDLENQLANKRREYERQRDIARKEVMAQLSVISDEISAKVRAAQSLARTVDLEFQWHDGYDEFTTWTQEDWDSSSRYC